MNKYELPIKGMHCRSCEILIEERLKDIPEIKNVQVSWKKKGAIIYAKLPIAAETFRIAVEEAGYEVGVDDSKDWITRDRFVWKDIGIAVVILTILYIVAKQFGLFNLRVGGAGNPSSLFVVLAIGLTAGFSTCMALVGGLILGISAKFAEKHPEASLTQKFRPHLFFNLGRITSYFLLGGVIGLAGKAFQLSGSVMGSLIILVGMVMLIVGAQLTELFPRLSSISFSLPAGVGKLFGVRGRHAKEYSHLNSMITGALTFFLPCGFTQAMQLFAVSSGNFWSGALIMATFALGTAPGLLSIGGLTSLVKGPFARRFFKGAGILVIVLALVNISNGAHLAGWNFKIPAKPSVDTSKTVTNVSDPNVVLDNGVQIVRMTQTTVGYSPKTFTIKRGIPVRWIVDSRDQNSCAASLFSQKFKIRSFLDAGENVFEFTPTELGSIPFSCSMGMYRGSFTVVENN